MPSGVQDERLRELAAIRRRATKVAVALVREPFSPATHAQMQTFVDEDAEAACALAGELLSMPESVLRAWRDQLCREGRRAGMPDGDVAWVTGEGAAG
jgi:hypothetical protein